MKYKDKVFSVGGHSRAYAEHYAEAFSKIPEPVVSEPDSSERVTVGICRHCGHVVRHDEEHKSIVDGGHCFTRKRGE